MVRMLVPVGRSGWAIASGYLGLLAIVPLGGLGFGVLAIITGILARKAIRANPRLGGGGRAIFGIVMGILGILVYGSIMAMMLVG